MTKFETVKDMELHMHVLLDATRRGWLDGLAIVCFTRCMLISGDILRRTSGQRVKESVMATFQAWTAAADKADTRGDNRIVCTGAEYQLAAKHVQNFSRAIESGRLTNQDVTLSQTYIDGTIYHD